MGLTHIRPLVIGGTGGSGTRLVARLIRTMGVDLGSDVNDSEDALSFVSLIDRYVDRIVSSKRVDDDAFKHDLEIAVRDHLAAVSGQSWGWKNPRSIYLLPLLDRLIPQIHFIHVIRHGLDMALSENRNQLNMHGEAVLGKSVHDLRPTLGAALLWQTVNNSAADYGETMRDRYFLVRFEDVCESPDRALAPVAAALNLPLNPEACREMINPRKPRWPELDAADLAELRGAIGPALERFGYQC